MPTTLSPVDICNVALSKIGNSPISSLTDTSNPSSIACNINFQLAYLEVSRASRWNCLVKYEVLPSVPQTPLTCGTVPGSVTAWAPNTAYAANVYLTYGGYYYQVMFAYTSTNNFENDLTTGALTQTNLPTNGSSFFPGNGSQYPSGWAFEFKLPDDFQLLVALNDNIYWDWYGAGTSDYQIMGTSIYCNTQQAVAQYVQNQPDTTRFDSLFTSALTFNLAAKVATGLRQDGGVLQQGLMAAYKEILAQARQKNGGEQQERRSNPITSSLFNRARWRSNNG